MFNVAVEEGGAEVAGSGEEIPGGDSLDLDPVVPEESHLAIVTIPTTSHTTLARKRVDQIPTEDNKNIFNPSFHERRFARTFLAALASRPS